MAEQKRRKDMDIELLAFNSMEVLDHDNNTEDPLIRNIRGGKKESSQATILPSPTPSRLSHKLQLWMANWEFGAKKIDVLSRSIFPVCFATFNMTYWYYYLSQMKDASQE